MVAADGSGHPLTCADYAVGGYSLEAYRAVYHPSPRRYLMGEHVSIAVGSNVTLVGLGRDAALKSFGLRIRNADNVIVRDLTISDTADCFPQ